MKLNEYGFAAGILAAAIALAPIAPAAASDAAHKAGLPPKNPPAARAPSIARVVVSPTPEQLAEIRAQKRPARPQKRALVATRSVHPAVADAL